MQSYRNRGNSGNFLTFCLFKQNTETQFNGWCEKHLKNYAWFSHQRDQCDIANKRSQNGGLANIDINFTEYR